MGWLRARTRTITISPVCEYPHLGSQRNGLQRFAGDGEKWSVPWWTLGHGVDMNNDKITRVVDGVHEAKLCSRRCSDFRLFDDES